MLFYNLFTAGGEMLNLNGPLPLEEALRLAGEIERENDIEVRVKSLEGGPEQPTTVTDLGYCISSWQMTTNVVADREWFAETYEDVLNIFWQVYDEFPDYMTVLDKWIPGEYPYWEPVTPVTRPRSLE